MVADARASSQGSQGRNALALCSSQAAPGNAEKARQREALAEKQRQYAREHEERMKLVSPIPPSTPSGSPRRSLFTFDLIGCP